MAEAKSKKNTGLHVKKLASSGLTEADAKKLGIEFLSATQTCAAHPINSSVESLKINYLGVDGKPLSGSMDSAPYYRLRCVGAPESSGFGEVAKQPWRYLQLPDTIPVAYYPQNDDWSQIAVDVNIPIIMTEGELKAAKACKEGYPTIGIGGVYSFQSKKYGIEWIDSLDLVEWKKRVVYICFDVDVHNNRDVALALYRLAKALVRKGASVFTVDLPDMGEDKKAGLDDFFVQRGKAAHEEFDELLSFAVQFEHNDNLWYLNEHYTHVASPSCVVCMDTGVKYSLQDFCNGPDAHLKHITRELNPKGEYYDKIVRTLPEWLQWEHRTRVQGLANLPNGDLLIEQVKYGEGTGRYDLNIWPGWGCQPKKGDVKPILELIDHLFMGVEDEAKQWFMQRIAYAIQHPTVKIPSAVVMVSVEHGVGKSMLGEVLRRIYGKTAHIINSKREYFSDFNGHLESAMLLIMEEFSALRSTTLMDQLKGDISKPMVNINPKGIGAYQVANLANMILFSNDLQTLALEDRDRRFFIHEVLSRPREPEFYTKVASWMDSGGDSHFFQYLLDYDTSAFNPFAPAYYTAAKGEMTANTRSKLDTWCHDLYDDPETVIKAAYVFDSTINTALDLYTSKQLLAMYTAVNMLATGTTRDVGVATLGIKLRYAGFKKAGGAAKNKLATAARVRISGQAETYWIVRNEQYWLKATPEQIKDHINGVKIRRKSQAKA